MGDWHVDAEHRAASGPRTHLNPVAENLRDALDNGQPQTDAFAVGSTADVQLVELEENRVEPISRNPTPGVPDFQSQHFTPTASPEQDAALVGVTAGVAEEVAQNPRHQTQVGVDREITHVHPQV